jgi:hypothetical protein
MENLECFSETLNIIAHFWYKLSRLLMNCDKNVPRQTGGNKKNSKGSGVKFESLEKRKCVVMGLDFGMIGCIFSFLK